MIIGIVGITGTLWISSGIIRSQEFPITPGSEWFRFNPEHFQLGFRSYFQNHFRSILKRVLILLIALYRKIAQKITLKQVIKKRVREFLYEHNQHHEGSPSDFWSKVRTSKKRLQKPLDNE